MTAAHPLAVLPLRRWRLDTTCLVIGSMSPDFEYFVRVKLASSLSHTRVGLVVFCVPITLIAAVLFHHVIKWPAIRVAPAAVARRLAPLAERPWMPRWSVPAVALLALSALLGAVTHLVWDGFTHAEGFGPPRIAALRAVVHLPVVGDMLVHRILQHTSTLVGLTVLAIVIARGLRRVPPAALPAPPLRVRLLWLACVAVVTALTFARILHAHETDPGSVIVAIIDGGLGGALLASALLPARPVV